jgi:hypothetical protein
MNRITRTMNRFDSAKLEIRVDMMIKSKCMNSESIHSISDEDWIESNACRQKIELIHSFHKLFDTIQRILNQFNYPEPNYPEPNALEFEWLVNYFWKSNRYKIVTILQQLLFQRYL